MQRACPDDSCVWRNDPFQQQGCGIQGCIRESEGLAAETGAFLPRQFSNPENVEAHQFGTAREILEQISGHLVDAVVSGVGTGGTLIGLMRGCNTDRHVQRAFLARPVDLGRTREQECCGFSCRIPGVMECASGLFRESDYLNLSTIEVSDEEAIETVRELIRLLQCEGTGPCIREGPVSRDANEFSRHPA